MGGHVLPLAKLGYECTGVDISSEMIRIALLKARKIGVNINYIRADVKNLPLTCTFDAVIHLYGVSAFEGKRSTVRLILRNINDVLKLGGILIINMLNANAKRKYI